MAITKMKFCTAISFKKSVKYIELGARVDENDDSFKYL